MKLTDFTTLTPIEYGWSGDTKYKALTADGTPYFLRITSRERGDRFARLFDLQKAVAATKIPMCQPIAIGECAEGVYAIHSLGHPLWRGGNRHHAESSQGRTGVVR